MAPSETPAGAESGLALPRRTLDPLLQLGHVRDDAHQAAAALQLHEGVESRGRHMLAAGCPLWQRLRRLEAGAVMLAVRLLLLFSAVSLAACAHKDEAKAARAAPRTTPPSSSDGGATSRSVSNIVLGAQGEAPHGELSFVAGWRVVSFDGPKLDLDGAPVSAECDWVRAVTVERDGERRRGSVLQPCEPRSVGVGGKPGRQGPALEDLVLGSAALLVSGAAQATPEAQSLAVPQPRPDAQRMLEEGRPVKPPPPRPSSLLFLELSPDETLKLVGGPAQGPDAGR